MLKTQIRNSLLLFLSAFIWGTAFVAQSSGMEHIGPFTFNFIRSMIGALVLLPVAVLSREKSENTKTLIFSATLSGIALGIATTLQQCGMLYTTVGKAGFLTALYIIIIPIVGIFMKKKCGINIWIAVLMALIGVYLLCITETFTINKGDVLEILCAVAFAVQIMIISHYSSKVNVFWFACIQFFVAGLISGGLTFTFEEINITQIMGAWTALLYAGVLSSGVAYTLQVIAQRDLNPTLAALIMSLESCFSVLAGWVILNEALGTREIIGCAITFAAIILAQIIPEKKE